MCNSCFSGGVYTFIFTLNIFWQRSCSPPRAANRMKIEAGADLGRVLLGSTDSGWMGWLGFFVFYWGKTVFGWFG